MILIPNFSAFASFAGPTVFDSLSKIKKSTAPVTFCTTLKSLSTAS